MCPRLNKVSILLSLILFFSMINHLEVLKKTQDLEDKYQN